MIHIKKQKNINLFHLLLNSKNFYGESVKKTEKEMSPFIYAYRHHFSIINLQYTSMYIKRIFHLIQTILKNNQKILLIHNANDCNFLLSPDFTRGNKNIVLLKDKWLHGFGTNKNIRTSSHFHLEDIQLILVMKTSMNLRKIKQEFHHLKKPVISLMNTDQQFKHVEYPVVTNLKHIQSIYVLMYLTRKLF